MDNEKTIHPVDLHVGSRVRLRRKMLGMSQSELSRSMGKTFQQLQKNERGNNRLSASALHQLSVALKVPVSYFFEGYAETESGEAISETERDVNNFLATAEGIELANVFPKIPARIRRGIMSMMRSFNTDA